MLDRFRKIFYRYGWRTPFVVLHLGLLRARTAQQLALRTWLKLSTGGRKGKSAQLGRALTITPGSYFSFGDDVYIGSRCTFEIGVNPTARVSIGSYTWISRDCHICSSYRIDIGSHVLIGEFVSIRDSTHDYRDRTLAIREQSDILGQVCIEDNVWVGRGCLIQGKPGGVIIGRGSIIAANSVVSQTIPPFQIWGGSPARFIKSR